MSETTTTTKPRSKLVPLLVAVVGVLLAAEAWQNHLLGLNPAPAQGCIGSA
jgi:hypothetical protein